MEALESNSTENRSFCGYYMDLEFVHRNEMKQGIRHPDLQSLYESEMISVYEEDEIEHIERIDNEEILRKLNIMYLDESNLDSETNFNSYGVCLF
jgi:hypothetical protein